MSKNKWTNHDIPDHYECYTCIVTRRGARLYMQIAFRPVGNTFEPYPENGIDIFLRSEWTDAIKVCYQNFCPNDDMRGSILRYIRKTFYPTAVFYRHVAPQSS